MSDAQLNLIDELRDLHPADLADRLQRLSVEEARDALGELPPSLAAGALGEFDRERVPELLAALPVSTLSPLLAELPPNDVADLVPALDPVNRRRALEGLSADHRERVFSLLRHAPDTAGGMMSDRFVILRAEETVHQSQGRLRDQPERRPEDISYLYVTDSVGSLVGVVPLRDLVFRAPDRLISDIMIRDVKSVRVDTDQEEVARQFEHYHYLGLPVLDAVGRLVGVVKASDALEVAQAEATEDMQLMVGLSGEERTLTPWTRSVRMRLPWLFVNLGTAFLAAAVVGLFESTIAKWTALAIFLPIIAGQGGNAAMQTLTQRRMHTRSNSAAISSSSSGYAAW